MLWLLLFAALAIIVGVLIAITTVRAAISDRRPGDPLFVFRFTIVWPSGPVTYEWPKRH